MQKGLALLFVFCYALSVTYGQGVNAAGQSAPGDNTIPRLDSAVKSAAADINRRLGDSGARNAAVGQFVYRERIPELGVYWNAQLVQELAAIPNRSWVLCTGPSPDLEWIVSGEIIEIAGVVRVYTRLIRAGDRAIAAGFQSDFNRDAFMLETLAAAEGRSVPVARDAHEIDSMAGPLAVELAASAGGPVIERTIHSAGDEDFFLLAPETDGMLVVETSGNTDTCLELYEADSGIKIADNDDGGSGVNARIRRSVRAGGRYIAKVRGYRGETGAYGFHAYMREEVPAAPDEYEEDGSFDAAKELRPGTPQRHTFHSGDDLDYIRFQIAVDGRYTIRAKGVNSNRLDTYIELFTAGGDSIAEDDDGGEHLDSRITRDLGAGTYYLMIKCLDDDPEEPYMVSVERE